MSGQRDRAGANPTRRASLTIGEGPHSARLTGVAEGILVVFCYAGKPTETETFDQPMHVVAERVHTLITQANRG